MTDSRDDLLLCELADKPLIREQAKDMLERLSWEPDERRRHAGYLRLARLIREIRGLERGFGARPLVVASLSAILFGSLLYYAGRVQEENTFAYRSPEYKIQILNRFDSWNYQFRFVRRDTGFRLISSDVEHAKFCPKPVPPFSAGEALTGFVYENKGGCWLLIHWDFELDARGHDSLAPNCHEGSQGYVECSPNLNEAIFAKEN